MRFLTVLALSLWAVSSVSASNGGYSISMKIEGFTEKELYLGYYMGDKQYLRDTATADQNGAFLFSGEEQLPGGVYLVVLPPDNRWFQILITEKEQQFSLETKLEDLNNSITFKGSAENTAFYKYLKYLAERSKEAEALQQQIAASSDEGKRKEMQDQLDGLGKVVKEYQMQFVRENPNSFAGRIIAANINNELPAFEGTEDEKMMKTIYYLREHYWDNLNIADPAMLRTPFLFEKLDYFVNKLHFQHPDSLAVGIDTVLARLRPAQESFRFYLVHFLNTFATSRIVGMDAVYVHLVDKYYAKGDAPWIAEEQLSKITENARTLKPLLIGKIAPDIQMERRDGSKIRLHEVKADYTILYFWRHDCGHCKESTPFLKEFYQKFKDKGVKIFAVCVKFRDEIGDCWKYIDENGTGDWIHTVDPYLASKFYTIYNVKTTPQLYILDNKKEIISKNIGAEQLEEVITKIMELRKSEQ